MKTQKLNTTESRIQDFFLSQNLIQKSGGTIQLGVVFTSSRTWGNIPTVYTIGGIKLASASGCGYDKHSACLAYSLKWLFERGTAEHGKISSCAGVGINSLCDALKECGYLLERTYYGKNEIGYNLTRI
jgi:hypothetical protein